MSLFICPLCQSPMTPAANTWRCDGSLNTKQTSHSFDVARQGYVNLLPVQQKKSKAPGDSQASIEARQRFLNTGYYESLQALVCQQINKLLQHPAETKKPINWLDIGCGEGYYTVAMAKMGMHNLIAADISKPAVTNLAKTCKATGRLWFQQHQEALDKTAAVYPLVTNAAHLPLASQSVKGISSIFSLILPEVFADALVDDGYLVIAKPDAGHLATMREALFDDVREHDSDKFLEVLRPYFTLVNTHRVSSQMVLSAAHLADLMTMTPYSYRARTEKRTALLNSAEDKAFHTEAKFVVYVLQKKAAAL